MLLSKYRDQDLIEPKGMEMVLSHIDELKEFIGGLSNILKLTVHVIGSYSAGLALRSDSPVDLLVVLDGGQLTSSLDNDQLAMALSAALYDWKSVGEMHQQGNQSGLLLCNTRGIKLHMNLFACDAGRIPASYIFHTVLFSSYARFNSRVPIFISMVKRWARASGISRRTASETCPLTGFHWTIIALHFLISIGLIPNLHIPSPRTTSLQRIQFGANAVIDTFAVIADEVVGRKVNKGSILNKTKNNGMMEYLKQFFLFLASTDLLNQTISLQFAGVTNPAPSPRGWLSIVDPCLPGQVNTINPLLSQKSVVTCGMLIQRLAKTMAEMDEEDRLAEFMFSQHAADKSNRETIDVAVP